MEMFRPASLRVDKRFERFPHRDVIVDNEDDWRDM